VPRSGIPLNELLGGDALRLVEPARPAPPVHRPLGATLPAQADRRFARNPQRVAGPKDAVTDWAAGRKRGGREARRVPEECCRRRRLRADAKRMIATYGPKRRGAQTSPATTP